MDFDSAFQIVIDLATENVLDDYDVHQDPEILGPIQRDQIKAIDRVTAEINKMDLIGMLE